MQIKEKLIQSPLNYTGGKYKLLQQIIPIFPDKIGTFIDLFCGGCNVGINIDANKIICNDINTHLISLLSFIQQQDFETLKNNIYKLIKKYELSDSATNKYSYYNCNSSKGLGNYNKIKYFQLRNDFNLMKTKNHDYYLYLYVLIIFGFNNQIRFNSKEEFNLPVGKRDFNERMQEKLKSFMNSISKIIFSQKNYIDFNFNMLTPNDFVYVDPPYLITCASYNENNGWNQSKETELLHLLDFLTKLHIKFALSNVLSTNGKTNEILKKWLINHKEYICHHLNYSYANSNYQKKEKNILTDEVLITNY